MNSSDLFMCNYAMPARGDLSPFVLGLSIWSQCWDFICPQRSRNFLALEAFYDIKDILKLPLQWR
jgi:hypothetical protein